MAYFLQFRLVRGGCLTRVFDELPLRVRETSGLEVGGKNAEAGKTHGSQNEGQMAGHHANPSIPG